MKKIVAFLLSASMCLSLLTALTPAFAAYEQSGEQTVQTRMADPDDKEPERELLDGQTENN